jgi:hypothetical protein
MKLIAKDPDALILVEIDWTRWLDGDTIAAPTWIGDGDVTAAADSNTTTHTYGLVGGGTVGATYRVTNRITTAGGQINDQSFIVRIIEK